jgi:hypothetical protein
MLNNSVNYLAIASIVRFSGLFSPYASKEKIPHMNSTSSVLPGSGVAPETSDQTARPKLLSQVRIVLRSRYYPDRIRQRAVVQDTTTSAMNRQIGGMEPLF